MNALEPLNRALAYLEESLSSSSELDLAAVARVAHCSEHHLRRMFVSLAGVSLTEYVRRRRLTLAAQDLQEGGLRVLDVAVKYGYGSADAFARAFQALHGMNPSECRGKAVQAFPRLNFQLAVQGGDPMQYRLVSKGPFFVVGFMRRVPLVYHGVNPAIAEMWKALSLSDIAALKALSDTEPTGMLSASTNFSEGRAEGGELDHYIGVATTSLAPEGFASLAVPALTWAVFEAVGPFPETLQSVWGRIYSEWFPSSSYQAAAGPELLWNEHPDVTAADYRSEIWIPVEKVG